MALSRGAALPGSRPPGPATLLLLLLLPLLAAVADARPKILPKLGACSSTVVAKIYVTTLADLAQRRAYPRTSTILLYLSNNITVDAPIYLTDWFSCTIVKADPALNGVVPFFEAPRSQNHTVVLVNVTNAMFIGVGFAHNWTYEWQQMCKPFTVPAWQYGRPSWFLTSDGYFDLYWTCGVLVVYRSFNVLISKAVVSGRVDIIRSGSVEVTYSNLYVDSGFWESMNGTRMAMGYGWNWAVVRIMLCGDQASLVRANNRITNNYIRGSSTSVLLYWGAVGNIIQNNYITGFGFSGLQCGQGMRNVADCMLNTFELNYIIPDPNISVDMDGSGIYYDLHWVNPGNRDSCNYLVNNGRCYYIDYATSGLLVEGGVCVMNGGYWGPNIGGAGGNFIKLNTGKFNVFRSMIWAHNGRGASLGWLSCQNWCINRCGPGTLQAEGNAWWGGYLNKYDNAMWRTNYPYMSTLCSAQGYTVGGVYYSCAPNLATVPNPGTPIPECYENMTVSNNVSGTYFSPSLELSGNCSGWPVMNDLSGIYMISNFSSTGKFYGNLFQMTIAGDCAPLGNFVAKTNIVPTNFKKYLPLSLGFNDEPGGDYGADDPSAYIYQINPNFYSCPLRLVGPQTASFASSRSNQALLTKFGKFRPRWLSQEIPAALKMRHPSLQQWAKKLRNYKRRAG